MWPKSYIFYLCKPTVNHYLAIAVYLKRSHAAFYARRAVKPYFKKNMLFLVSVSNLDERLQTTLPSSE